MTTKAAHRKPGLPSIRPTRRPYGYAGRKLHLGIAGVALALSVALTGCGLADETTSISSTTSSSTTSSSAAQATTSAKKSPSDVKATQPDVAAIGQTWTYESGLKVSVVSLKKIKISKYASGGTASEQGVLVTVRITNATDATFNAVIATVDVKYGSDGDPSDRIFDSGVTNADGFGGTIRAGRRATAAFEFAIPKSKSKTSLDISVSPDIGSEPAEFTGQI